jgi:hypothetical protein
MPIPRQLKMNIWILATPIKKTVVVVTHKHKMTALVNGTRWIPPPGAIT